MTIRNRFRLNDEGLARKPEVPEDLLKYLNEIIPDRCPEMSMNDREIWFTAGKRSVVNMLQAWFDVQSGAKSAPIEGDE